MKIKSLLTCMMVSLVTILPLQAQVGKEMKAFRNKDGITVTMLNPPLYSLYKQGDLSLPAEEALKDIKEINVMQVDIKRATPKVVEEISQRITGLRYAFSSFKYDVSTMPADDPIWGDVIGNPSLEDGYWGGSVPFSHLGMKGSVQWLEIVLGVKVRIYKNFNMGWSVRMKYKTKASTGEYGDPWYVPGYGKFKSNNMGITYSLIYKLPL